MCMCVLGDAAHADYAQLLEKLCALMIKLISLASMTGISTVVFNGTNTACVRPVGCTCLEWESGWIPTKQHQCIDCMSADLSATACDRPRSVRRAVDVYAFSMIAFELFEGWAPFLNLHPVDAARRAALHHARPQWGKVNRCASGEVQGRQTVAVLCGVHV